MEESRIVYETFENSLYHTWYWKLVVKEGLNMEQILVKNVFDTLFPRKRRHSLTSVIIFFYTTQ